MALRNVALVSQLLLLALTDFKWFALPVTASGWHYEPGENGPEDWPGLCQAGTRQSPIDLDPAKTVPGHFEPLVVLNYDRKLTADVTNNGHTVMMKVNQACPMVMAAGGLPGVYQLDQIHFHWKAEHTLRGKRLPLEMHIVHHNRKYSSLAEAGQHHEGIAVLGVLFYISDQPNNAFKPILDGVAKIHAQGDVTNLSQRIEVDDLLPTETTSFYRYHGSLTTPTCDESVVWTVLTNLVPIGADQVEQFQKIKSHHEELKANYRPIQELDNRRIYLQHPSDLSYDTSVSSRLTLSSVFVFICGLLSVLS